LGERCRILQETGTIDQAVALVCGQPLLTPWSIKSDP